MTANDILNMTPEQISRFNAREMKAAFKTIIKAANQRIDRLHKAGLYGEKNKFSGKARGSSRNDLYGRMTEAMQFMNSEKSTVPGYRKWQSNVIQGVKKEAGFDLSKDLAANPDYWKKVDHAMEAAGSADKKMRYAVMEEVAKAFVNHIDISDQDLQNFITETYEEAQDDEDYWTAIFGDDDPDIMPFI